MFSGHCAFGIDTDMQNDLNNVYMQKSMACFAVDGEKLPLVKLTKVVPFLAPVLGQLAALGLTLLSAMKKKMPNLLENSNALAALWIVERVEEVIKQRLKSGQRRTDLLQLMLDAATDEEVKVSQFRNVEEGNIQVLHYSAG